MEEELGANDDELCTRLYLENEEAIQLVKSALLPFTKGVEEARQNVRDSLEAD